jgi:hypothetical protein
MLAVAPDGIGLQPRHLDAIERCLGEVPAQGRVDQTLFFLVTSDPRAEKSLFEYTRQNAQARIPVLFKKEILTSDSKAWSVRNTIADQLFSRDLFDYLLPLDDDLVFFGRDAVVYEFLDAIKKPENRGLFGLRKSGKTSVLKKVERLARKDGHIILYYDCKLPQFRSLRWTDFLARITDDARRKIGRPAPASRNQEHVSDRFASVLKALPRHKNLVLIFDEIEYVSPLAILDKHWRADFIPFWQTLWATQSEHRRLSFLVAGINPTVSETSTIDGVQNPMFGIVRPVYLRGFDETELKAMLDHFGSRMGLQFSPDATKYLLERYGGHPSLTRMACSLANTALKINGEAKPVRVSRELLSEGEALREQDMTFYGFCDHVVSELRDYHPDEYYLLEKLALGNVAEFTDFAVDPRFTQHLKQYGLLVQQPGSKPTIRIPVLAKHVAWWAARRDGTPMLRDVVAPDRRVRWLQEQTKKILEDIRYLQKAIEAKGSDQPQLYGTNGIPEAERFITLTPVDSADGFSHFINVTFRCFVESLQSSGKKRRVSDYLPRIVKGSYAELWHALERIRLYRHNAFHIELRQKTEQDLAVYLAEDLFGRRPSQVPELYFVLQQCVVDGLLVGVRCEIDRLG